MLTLAEAEKGRSEALSEAAMYRIAACRVADYWREQYGQSNGARCDNCSRAQRLKCRSEWTYPVSNLCPKAVKLESLEQEITDSEGNLTHLGELIADDDALDLEAWVDASVFLTACPTRLIAIAMKRSEGEELDTRERMYLSRWRTAQQQSLELDVTKTA